LSYRAKKQGLGGTVHCMLAVQVGAVAPPLFRIHRPATGRAAKIMKLEELQNRCCLPCSNRDLVPAAAVVVVVAKDEESQQAWSWHAHR